MLSLDKFDFLTSFARFLQQILCHNCYIKKIININLGECCLEILYFLGLIYEIIIIIMMMMKKKENSVLTRTCTTNFCHCDKQLYII